MKTVEKENNQPKKLWKFFNFNSDLKRLLLEYISFLMIFVFIEIFASIALKYVMPIQYIVMFLITLTFIFFLINIIKNWKGRFTCYTIASVYIFAMSVLNCVYINFKHDAVSTSMVTEVKMGLEFLDSAASASYSPINVFGVAGFILIILIFLALMFFMFAVCFRNNRQKTTLYPRLLIGFIAAYFIALPIYSCNYAPFAHMPYEKFFSAQTIGQLNYLIQDLNCLIYREVVEKNTVFYVEPENPSLNETYSLTGSMEGKNVIQIMLEEEDYFFINEKYTPNLYNLMYKDGISFSNFYSTFSYLSTFDAEFKTLTSAMGYTCNNYYLAYPKNHYKNAIPNVLSNHGYTTIGMHNYRSCFFERDKLWANMGFDELYFIEQMDFYKELYPEFTDWYDSFPNVDFPPDSVMFKEMASHYAPTDLSNPFYSYILTIGSHQTYNEHRSTLQEYYDILAKDPMYDNYSSTYITDMVTIMDTDKGIGYMLDHLKTNNMLDDTLIVIYTDHHSYNNEEDFAGYRDFSENPYDIFRVPCVIYNPSLTPQVNDMLCSQYDIVPTIFDLLGIKYKTDYYYGQSLFADTRDDRPIIFGAYKWMNSKMYARNFDYVLLDSEFAYPEDSYKENSKYVWNTIQKFNYFIYSDYFKNANIKTYVK